MTTLRVRDGRERLAVRRRAPVALIAVTALAGLLPAVGAASAQASTVPGAPVISSVTAGDRQLTVSWSASSAPADQPVIDYQVMYRVGSSGGWSVPDDIYGHSYDSGVQSGTDRAWTHNRDPLDLGVIPSGHASGVQNYVERTSEGRHGHPGVYRVKADVAALRIRVEGDPGGAATMRLNYTTDPITDLRHNGEELARVVRGATQTGFRLGGVTPPLGAGDFFWIDGFDHTDTRRHVPRVPEFGSTTISDRRLRIDVAGVSTATTAVVGGLTNQSSYEVRVRARSSAGWGAWSSTSTGTPTGTPDAPDDLELESGDGQIIARWSTPANNGGAAISDYDIQYRTVAAGATWTDWQAATVSTDTAATIDSGISNGTAYRVRVRSVSSAGDGPWSLPVTQTAGKPSAPTVTLSTVQRPLPTGKIDKGGLLSVSAVAAANGSAVTDYDVRYRKSGTTAWYTFRDRSLDSGRLTTSESSGPADPIDIGTFGTPSGAVAVTRESIGSGGDAKHGLYKFSKAIDQLWIRAGGTITGGGTVVARWHTAKPSASDLATAGTEIFTATTDSDSEFWQDGWVDYLPADAYVWLHTSDAETLTERRVLFDFTDNSPSGTMVLTGLHNGSTYEVQARAANARGDGGWGAASGTAGTPTRPAVDALVLRHQSLGVTWAEPISANGVTVTDYDVRYRAATSESWTAWSHVGTGRAAIIRDLTNGTAYQVQVRAVNSRGRGPWSAGVTGTPAIQPPDAPAVPTLTSSGTTLTVNWTTPAPNGAAVTDYDIEYSSDSGATWRSTSEGVSTATSQDISGLTNAVTYVVRVRARNSAGVGSWSTQATITIGLPSTPAAPTLAPGDEKLTVAWSAVSGNGAPVTDYDVAYTYSPTTCVAEACWTLMPDTTPSTALSTVLTDVLNGLTYRVRVRAQNSIGTGAWSPESAMTPGLPSAPFGITAAPGDQTLRVTWMAPSSNGYAITEYELQYCSVACELGDSSWSPFPKLVHSSVRAWTLRNLTNGTRYYVRMRGINRTGNGIWSSPASTVPGRPAAPAAPTLWGGDHKIVVGWAPPASNGSTISDYDVRYCVSGCDSDANWTALADTVDSTDRPALIDGLDAGTTYRVQVRAQNSVGAGQWSAGSTHTLAVSPVPPQGFRACTPAGLTQLWAGESCYLKPGLGGIKPFDAVTVRGDGGDYVRLYDHPSLGLVEVAAYNPQGGAAVIETSLGGTAQDVVVVDAIRFAIRGHSISHSGATADLTVWLASPDSSSTDIYAKNGIDYARSWIQLGLPEALRGATHDGDDPSGDWVRNPIQVVGQHGDSITFRLLVLSHGSHTIGISAHRPAPDASCPLTGPLRCFTPPTPQTQISYVTSAQASATFQSGTVAVPAQFTPTLTAEYGTGEIVAAWEAPADNGAPITAYQVQHRRHPGGSWAVTHTLDGDTRSATITGVEAGETHRVRVRARNAAGWGRMSWPLAEVTVPTTAPPPPPSPPGAVSSVTVERSAGVLEASWPAVDGATSYHVTYRSMSGGTWQLAALNHPSNSITISGVDDAAAYLVGVRARNSAGDSGWRNSSQAPPFAPPPPQQPPGAVSSVTVVRSAGVLEASWPAVSGATSYHVTYRSLSGGTWQLAALNHASNSITISGVDDSAAYLVGVRARNSAGDSGWRNSSPVSPL